MGAKDELRVRSCCSHAAPFAAKRRPESSPVVVASARRAYSMASPDESMDDIFKPDGQLRLELLTEPALAAIRESLCQARETHWDSVRSPHIFMGLLAVPDAGVRNWGERLGADLPKLLGQFQELFHQEEGDPEALLVL